MKKKTLLTLLLMFIVGSVTVSAQQKSDVFLTREELPDLLKWLPAPPDSTSEAFVHDIMRYMWGKTQRLDPVRADIAKRDAIYDFDITLNTFSSTFGMTITKDETPEIYDFMLRSVKTCDQIGRKAKEYYQRKRPFMVMNEHMLSSWEEEDLRTNGSYPSGHTIRGWSIALLLMQLNPEAADTLLARGMMYGESRVIVGAHWQSDVDAGRLASSAAFARLQTCPAYQEQLARAVAEFRWLRYGIPIPKNLKRNKKK